MAQLVDADAISAAVQKLEASTKQAVLAELCEELRAWAPSEGQDEAEFAGEVPGVNAVLQFIESNYVL